MNFLFYSTMFQQCTNFFSEKYKKYVNKDKNRSVFFLEKRITGLSFNVSLIKMVIKLTVLLGYKVRNEKRILKCACSLMG